MDRTRWAAVVVAGVVVGLTGCSTGGTPAPTALTDSVSSTPTLPAPVASPAWPDHWADTGQRGASVAAVWFVRDLYRYVVETNDSTQWQALSDPTCVFCANTTKAAQDGLANGTVERLASVQVTATRVEELNPLAYAVLMDYSDGGSSVQSLDGRVVRTNDAGRGQLLAIVHLVGPDWQLRAAEWFESGADVPTAGATS